MVEKASVPASPPATAPAPEAPTTGEASTQTLPGGRTTRTDFVPAGSEVSRPSWLPTKFSTPEAMAQAYGELERKLGQPSAAAPAATRVGVPDAPSAGPAPAGGPPAAADLVAKMTQEYAQTGAVSPETRQEFVQRTGLADTFVDQQISFMRGREKSVVSLAVTRLGSEGAVQELQDWAGKRLSQTDRQAFNRAVYSGDDAMASLALDGLAAKYEMEVGRSPKVIAGRRPQEQFGGAVAFQSHAEWSVARKDSKYKTDPAYREQVEERLRASMELGLI